MSAQFENKWFRWIVDGSGNNVKFLDKLSGRDVLCGSSRSSCAYIVKDGWKREASGASFDGSLYTLCFGDDAGAELDVETNPDYLVFTVKRVWGEFDELAFVNIPTVLEIKPDEPFSACTIALSLKSNVEQLPGPQSHIWTCSYRRFGFEGAQTGLVACPFGEMREALKAMVSNAPQVPHSPLCGPFAKDAELPRRSNVFGSPTEANVDQWIEFCHAMGISAIEMDGTINYGSYQPNPAVYPNGYASVKAVIDKLHDAGIAAGLHTMSFSIAKNCDWVTPIPDPRLAKERTYTLAKGIDETQDTIYLVEPTDTLPDRISYYIRRSLTLQIDNELIQYTWRQTTKPYAVMECKRGILGTKATAHAAGAPVHHLVECWGCFAPDGESTLFSEVAQRIANCINQCGFDFCYLDGLDGSHVIAGLDLAWHYGAKFTFEVFKYLDHPIMMEMATFTHHLWYVRTRMQAWDHAVRGHKTFLNLHLKSNDQARRLFMPLHLGWAGLGRKTNIDTDATYWDDIDYLWSKALATDSNYTLQRVSPGSMTDGDWLKTMAPTIRKYEELRQKNMVDESTKQKLAVLGDEYHLQIGKDGGWSFRQFTSSRHQVTGLDDGSGAWSFANPFGAQPLSLRITALNSVGAYESGVEITDFGSGFFDPGPTIKLLNSGKTYVYPSSAPGISSKVENGVWTGSNAGVQKEVQSSSPDDKYSLYDHCERIFSWRQASWTSLQLDFKQPKDLSETPAFGIWVNGDNQGQLLNIILMSRSYGDMKKQYVIPVNFSGWKYFELVESDPELFDQHSWPFSREQYSIHRSQPNYKNCLGLQMWMNEIPAGKTVSVQLKPMKALPLLQQKLVNPSITIGGQTMVFPVEMEPNEYLEVLADGSCKWFDAKGTLKKTVVPQGTLPTVAGGNNQISFNSSKQTANSRAYVTMFAWK